MHTISDKKILMLKPEQIVLNRRRGRQNIDDYDLRLLADSIHTLGMIVPLAVYKSEEKEYILISGERRFKAAKLAGLRRIPCVLHKATPVLADIYTITENLSQAKLHYFEEAASIKKLMRENSFSEEETALSLGISQNMLKEKLSLLKLDSSLQERMIIGGLCEKQAKAVLRLPEEKRAEAVEKIITAELGSKQTEKYIEKLLFSGEKPPEKEEKPIRKAVINDARLFENSLQRMIVTLKNSGFKVDDKRIETDKFLEFRIKILKQGEENKTATQLKIV